jgi:hypothetical protein
VTKGGFSPPTNEDPAKGIRQWVERLPPSVHATWMLRQTLLSEQLAAIKDLMHRNQQAAAATQIKFDELKAEIEANPDNERLDDIYDERFWQAVFMGSAHSMSAVGMLAPFIESLFVAIYGGLRKRQPPTHQQPTSSAPELATVRCAT